MSKSKRTNPFVGHWRITSMSEWDKSFIDAEVKGYIQFDDNRMGKFHFGYVHCEIDYDVTEREGKPAVEFSFEGTDEMDPTTGRGWGVLVNDKELNGQIAFHRGDRSEFTAKRMR